MTRPLHAYTDAGRRDRAPDQRHLSARARATTLHVPGSPETADLQPARMARMSNTIVTASNTSTTTMKAV